MPPVMADDSDSQPGLHRRNSAGDSLPLPPQVKGMRRSTKVALVFINSAAVLTAFSACDNQNQSQPSTRPSSYSSYHSSHWYGSGSSYGRAGSSSSVSRGGFGSTGRAAS